MSSIFAAHFFVTQSICRSQLSSTEDETPLSALVAHHDVGNDGDIDNDDIPLATLKQRKEAAKEAAKEMEVVLEMAPEVAAEEAEEAEDAEESAEEKNADNIESNKSKSKDNKAAGLASKDDSCSSDGAEVEFNTLNDCVGDDDDASSEAFDSYVDGSETCTADYNLSSDLESVK